MIDNDSVGEPGAGSHTTFVLGAGFSRAISNHMPLTDELGQAALDALRDDLPPRLALQTLPPGLNFETWLSQLASDQPYLSDTENAQNQAAFLMFSEAIARILGQRVDEVLAGAYPEWLLTFVSALHHSQSTVITFNYDPLIECMVATPTGILGDPNHYGEIWNGVAWSELSGGLPPWAPGPARLADTQVETFRLLKLHGSLNWYWRAGDESGVSVARRQLPGHFEKPDPYTDEKRRREVPGRVPFVVPPAASKSQYYSNPITKEMWSQAAERLKRAKTIILAGYSLPATDTTFGNLLREAALDRDSRIVIADRTPAPVRDRLVGLGFEQGRISIASAGDDAIPVLVSGWAHSQSQGSLSQLAEEPATQARLLLAWGDRTAYAPVEAVEWREDRVTARSSRTYSSFNLATGLNSRPAITVNEARAELRTGRSSGAGLRAGVDGLPEQIVIGIERTQVGIGQGDGVWIVLQVGATPPVPSAD